MRSNSNLLRRYLWIPSQAYYVCMSLLLLQYENWIYDTMLTPYTPWTMGGVVIEGIAEQRRIPKFVVIGYLAMQL